MVNIRKRNWVSLKSKLILIYLPITIIPIIIFSLFISNIYDKAMTKRTLKSVEDSNVVISDRITRVLIDSENCANYLTVNINRIISNQYKQATGINDVVVSKLITNELNSSQVVFNEIESITYIDKNGNAQYSDYRLMNNVDKIMESSYYKQLQATSGESIWFKATVRDFLVTDKEKQVLTLGKKVISTTSGKTVGYLFLNLDTNQLVKHLDSQLIRYWLIDDAHNTISSTGGRDLLNEVSGMSWLSNKEQDFIINTNTSRYLLTKSQIENYKWTLLGVTDLNEVDVETQEIITMIMAVAFSAILLIVIMSVVFTTIVTAPLRKLKQGAEQIAEGNLNIRFHFRTEDEIGQLGKSFNYMSQRVLELLEKVDCEAKMKRKYELSLLQEQVKPHFLYNTLDIIIKLSAMNKNRDAQRVAKKLADYYRGSLSNSKENITIAEEIQITKDYLELQKMRYTDLFEYEVDVQSEIDDVIIPKLTLQPLVENAIYHGLKYKEGKGKILIKGRIIEDKIALSVIDNGIGMESESSNVHNFKNKSDKHFGVYSVNHRIKLYFGEEYGLEIDSEYGIGTEVRVMVPKEK